MLKVARNKSQPSKALIYGGIGGVSGIGLGALTKSTPIKYIAPALLGAAGVMAGLRSDIGKGGRDRIKDELKDPRLKYNIIQRLKGKSREEIVAGHKTLPGYPFKDSPESKVAARGDGLGVGGNRQRDLGADTCVCPKCGYKEKHTQATPCSSKKCPKCGTVMGGANSKEKTSMEKSALSTKLLASAARKSLKNAKLLNINNEYKNQMGKKSLKFLAHAWASKGKNPRTDSSIVRNVTDAVQDFIRDSKGNPAVELRTAVNSARKAMNKVYSGIDKRMARNLISK